MVKWTQTIKHIMDFSHITLIICYSTEVQLSDHSKDENTVGLLVDMF